MGSSTTSGFEPSELGEGAVVHVPRIRLLAYDDRARGHEAAQVVDVSVGVVPGEATPEPDGVGATEGVEEDLLVVGPTEAGVADLDEGIEEAFFGRQ
jgi:hypothetical protein